MGHERIGILPKRKKWINILDQLSSLNADPDVISNIAQQTLVNVENRFLNIPHDRGVLATVKFLVIFSVSMRYPDPYEKLSQEGILIQKVLTPLNVGKALKEWVSLESDRSLEYSEIAQYAAFDALANWYRTHNVQNSLFESLTTPNDIWHNAGTATGFCNLSRLFFAKFTERYLRYFLEREASAYIDNIEDRELFDLQLYSFIDDISLHAFETSKITESYAAGWFNKHALDAIPSEENIQEFINYAFYKIRNELSGEAETL